MQIEGCESQQYTAAFSQRYLSSLLPGDAYDNALADSTIGLFKNEAIRDDNPFRNGPLKSLDDVEWVTMARVDWCNSRRLHSTPGDVPADEYEAS